MYTGAISVMYLIVVAYLLGDRAPRDHVFPPILRSKEKKKRKTIAVSVK